MTAIALAVVASLVSANTALTQTGPDARAAPLPGQPALHTLQQQQRRSEFQRLQQGNREQDRRDAIGNPPVLDVPVVRPGCQVQVYGNRPAARC